MHAKLLIFLDLVCICRGGGETAMQQHEGQFGWARQDRQEWVLLLQAGEADHFWVPQVQGLLGLLSSGHMQRAHQPPRRSRRRYTVQATSHRSDQAASLRAFHRWSLRFWGTQEIEMLLEIVAS